ncbi:hypothetical protein HDV02_001908 [Globomyces sp. JEL0801]|nr:hypothetical protein HDV02_001908 [Globomyces sp. JEL0801]
MDPFNCRSEFKKLQSDLYSQYGPQLGMVSEDFHISPCNEKQTDLFNKSKAINHIGSFRKYFIWNLPDDDFEIKFKSSWNKLIQMNEILRTCFVQSSNELYQFVIPYKNGKQIQSTETELDEYLQLDLKTPFVLGDSPWCRLMIVENGFDKHLVFSIHELLADDWTCRLLLSMLEKLVNTTVVSDVVHVKTVVPIAEKQHDYMINYFQSYSPKSIFVVPPVKGTESESNNFESIKWSLQITKSKLELASVNVHTEPDTLLKVTWGMLLQIFTQSDDVLFASNYQLNDIPFEGVEVLNQNLMVMPYRLNMANQTVSSLMEQFKINSKDKQYHVIDADQLKAYHDIETLFNYTNSTDNFLKTSLNYVFKNYKNGLPKFKMNIEITSTDNFLNVLINYNKSYISKSYVIRLIEIFDELLLTNVSSCLISNVSGPIQKKFKLPRRQRQRILEFGKGVSRKLAFQCIHYVFERMVEIDPGIIAMEHGMESVTYGDLNHRANQLAALILANRLKVGDNVAIFTTRSIEMVVAILAVLKAGCSVLIIDIHLPLERIEVMLATADSKLILCHPSIDIDDFPMFSKYNICLIQQNSENMDFSPPLISSLTSAYVTFTSGSTSRPKGVAISHQSLVNFCTSNLYNGYNISKDKRVAQVGSITFDICIADVLSTLTNQGTLVLTVDDDYLTAIQNADQVVMTPTLVSKFSPSDFPNLKRVVLGGEKLSMSIVNEWTKAVTVINGYGPTETTLCSSTAEMKPDQMITIGNPIPNTNFYLVDKQLELVPIGVPGELVIGGLGIALGYLNQPELTAEKFINNHFTNDGTEMFRTGDLCRWTENGEIELIGRQDDMIKLKGYRIELNEISSIVLNYPHIHSCEILVNDNNIIAYVTPTKINIELLRSFVSDRLPHYMLPSVYIAMDSFPMTINGKVDKQELSKISIQNDLEIPQTEIEMKLAIIWSELLNIDVSKIGRHSSFFQLGGDSLKLLRLSTMIQELDIHLTTNDIFKYSTLAQMASMKESNDTPIEIKPLLVSSEIIHEIYSLHIAPHESNVDFDIYPATPLQSTMIVNSLKSPSMYLHQYIWKTNVDLNAGKLEEALNQIISCHAILKTRFVTTRFGIYQLVPPELHYKIQIEDDLESFLSIDRTNGFQIQDQSWFRLTLIQNGKSYSHVVLTIHHVLFDHWSLDTFVNQLFGVYEGGIIQQQPHFKRVVEYIQSHDFKRLKDFWKSYLSGYQSNLELNDRYLYFNATDGFESLQLEKSLRLDQLNDFASRHRVTVPTLVKTAWALTLSSFMQTNDVVFSNLVSGRDLPIDRVESIVGLLTNNIPCRFQIDRNLTIARLLKNAQEDYYSVLPHSQCSNSSIKRWIGKDKLCDTMFVYHNQPLHDFNTVTSVTLVSENQLMEEIFEGYSLVVIAEPLDGNLSINLAFCNIDSSLVKNIGSYLVKLLENLIVNDYNQVKVSRVLADCLVDHEKLLTMGKGISKVLPYKCAHHGIEAIAASNPDDVAIEESDKKISYGDLNSRANHLANHLILQGLQIGQAVGIVTTRSIEMVIAFLAVLKAGGAIMVIDHTLPADRIQTMLQISQCQFLLYHFDIPMHRYAVFDDLKCYQIDMKFNDNTPFKPILIPTLSGAYIAFTSGSTSNPKAVLVTHRSLVNFVTSNGYNGYDIAKGTRVAQVGAIIFDMCISDVLATLTNNGILILTVENDYYTAISKSEQVVMTPTLISKFKPSDFPNLKRLILGGELLPQKIVEEWSHHVTLINGYGPSEATLCSSTAVVQSGKCITIGKPIPNVNHYIVDKYMQLVPIGVLGELVIGGAGVAQGYLNQPELTFEKFILNHFTNDGTEMYRTGDIGRWTEDGQIEILGRMDDMVKLKGYRIELDMISYALTSHLDVDTAAVWVNDDILLACITPSAVDVESVRSFVADMLPHYMIPAVIITMETLPMNANGKIDKKQLSQIQYAKELETPVTVEEHQMAGLWSEILGVDVSIIGRNTSFFELGGDSLLAIRLVVESKKKGFELTNSIIFKKPTLIQLATYKAIGIDIQSSLVSAEIIHRIYKKYTEKYEQLISFDIYPATPLQSSMVNRTLLYPNANVTQIVWNTVENPDIHTMELALMHVVNCHDILKTRFVIVDDVVYQVVPDKGNCEVIIGNCLETYLKEDKLCGFNLDDRNWIRVAFIGDEEEAVYSHIVFTIHNALSDGYSMESIINDIFNAYYGNAIDNHQSFKTVVEMIESKDQKYLQAFLESYLHEYTPPPGFSKSDDAIKRVDNSMLEIPSLVTIDELITVSASLNIDITSLLNAAWALTLKVYKQQDDVAFARLVSYRDAPDNENSVVGMMLNHAPCRMTVRDYKTIDELLHMAQEDSIDVLPYTFCNLQEWNGHHSISEIFDTLLIYEDKIFEDESKSVNKDLLVYPHDNVVEPLYNFDNFDIQVHILQRDRLVTKMIYNGVKVDFNIVSGMAIYFNYILSEIVNPVFLTKKIQELNVIPEENDMLIQFGTGPYREISHQCTHYAFEDMVEIDPDVIAVEFDGESITYGELNERANNLAAQLMARGVKVGDFVAVLTIRSIEMIIGFFAVLKAGAAFLPIDSNLDLERILFMLETCSCQTILVHHESVDTLESINMFLDILDLHEIVPGIVFEPPTILSFSPAYAIFTSGSTGTPKGVSISHIALSNYACVIPNVLEVKKGTRVAQVASISFDICISDIFSTLCCHGTLVLRNDFEFESAIQNADTLQATPTFISKLNPDDFPSLRRINLGGEILQPHLAAKWSNRVTLVNGYGPTETTITSSFAVIKEKDVITVGKPMPNTVQYIVGKNMQLVPVGVPGELLIGGMGVALGYINQPGLTAQKFIDNRFLNDGSKMYRTGDICRWTADGNIQILGRMDDLVKVNGYRVELDEVSFAIAKHPDVTGASVLLKEDQLFAYITPQTVNLHSVLEYVTDRLPSHMIPAVFVTLNVFPMNANGKIDKYELAKARIPTPIEIPANEAEKTLAEIWSTLLNVDITTIGRETTFAELGGDEVKINQLVTLCQEFGWRITTLDVTKFQTLKKISLLKPKFEIKEEIYDLNMIMEMENSGNDQYLVNKLDYDEASPGNIELTNPLFQDEFKSRPISVVCLHGEGSCESIFRNQLSYIKKYLGYHVQFHFIEALNETESFLSDHYGTQVYEWWSAADGNAKVYESIRYVTEHLKIIGPVDAILGFSQGASLVELLDQISSRNLIERTWEFSILFSGIPLNTFEFPEFYNDEYPDPLTTKAIVLSGAGERGGLYDSSEMIARYSTTNSLFLEHTKGHEIPQYDNFIKQFAEQLLRFSMKSRFEKMI